MLTEHGKAAKRTALAATAIAALSLAATLLSARSVLAEAKLVRTDPPNDSILTEAPVRRQAASAGRFDTSASLGDHLLGPPTADGERWCVHRSPCSSSRRAVEDAPPDPWGQ